ncbi:DUF2254 domain-containing protein [Bacillus sp. AK031]
MVTIMVDYYWAALMERFLPDFMMTQIDLAQTVLSTIAGSLLAMTTFTFSTVMVVLTTYSSQFSPRALKNFVNDNTTLRGLGIFMGGFIYSITALNDGQLTMTDKDGTPRLNIPFFDFDRLLYKTFYQIVHYAKEDISVILALLDAMYVIQIEMPPPKKAIVEDFHHYILQNVNKDQLQKWDLHYLNEKVGKLTVEKH